MLDWHYLVKMSYLAELYYCFKKGLILNKYFIALCVFLFSLHGHAKQIEHLRYQRYCEVLVANGISSIEIYSTLGLNDCPQSLWKNLSIDEIKSRYHSFKVVLNGPRYWVIDKMQGTMIVESKLVSISGLKLRLVAQLQNVLYLLFKNTRPYQEVEVTRHTTWIYEPGLSIYELIDPKGQVYVMQSYSIQSHPEQTPQSLANLGQVLQLPEGWKFKTGINPKELLVKTTDSTAIVIQDDYQNTYQRMDKDVLN